MDFHEEKFPVVEFLSRLAVKEGDQPFHQLRNNFRVIVQLNRHDAEVAGWRIGHDVREIAIEGRRIAPSSPAWPAPPMASPLSTSTVPPRRRSRWR